MALTLSSTVIQPGFAFSAVVTGRLPGDSLSLTGNPGMRYRLAGSLLSVDGIPPTDTPVEISQTVGGVTTPYQFAMSVFGVTAGAGVSAKASTVPVTTGSVYTVLRLLGSTSTLALASGTNSNLTLNATTGVISATAAIAAGVSQTAVVSETLGNLGLQYPVVLTGAGSGVVTLNTLTVSNSTGTVGTALSSTISGLTAGSSVALTGAGAAGLSISGAVINGTPTTAGAVNIVETLAGAINSPNTTSGAVTIAAAGASPLAGTVYAGMWADKIASVGWYSLATGRNALYDATSTKTYMALEEVNTASATLRSSNLYATDAAGARTGPFKLFDSTLVDDDHGVPNIAMGPNRRIYAAGGVHNLTNTPMIFTMSPVNDYTSFTSMTGPTAASDASAYAYPHIVFRTSAAGNIIRRKETTAGNNMTLVDTPLTINGDGTFAWGTETTIVNFGGGRVYANDPILLPNGKLRIAFTYADYPDTLRQDVFVGDYDTAAGTLTSPFNGVALTCPASLTGCRTNLRATQQFENNLYGGIPAHVFDAAGDYHLAYLESATANTTGPGVVGSKTIYYKRLPAGSQTLTAATLIATTIERYSTYDLRVNKAGLVELDFISLSPFFTNRVGDVSRVKRNSDGTWGAPFILRACSSYAGFDRPQTVVNGNAGPIQSLLCECSYADNGNTGGSNNPTTGTLRAYAFSADVAAAISVPTDQALTTAMQRLSTQPSALSVAIASQVTAAYRNLGILTTRDAMWLQTSRIAAELDFARLDLIGTNDLTMNSGMSFAQVSGKNGYSWLGDGVTGVQDTGYNPTGGGNLTLNSVGVIFDVVNEGQRAAAAVSRSFSATGVNTLLLNPRSSSDTATGRVNDGTAATNPNTTAVGTYVLRRNAASGTGAKRITKNGVSFISASTTSTALPGTKMLWGGGGTGDGNPSGTYQLALGSFGATVGDNITPIIAQIHYRFRQEMGVL